MELMVVVIIVAVLSALAIPAMVQAVADRRAYNDAAWVMQLFRQARFRAIGRGTAVAVMLTSAPGTDRGTLQMYEAVTNDPGAAASASERYPLSSCINADWTAPPAVGNKLLVDGIDLNGAIDSQASYLVDIQSTIHAHYIDAAGTDTNAVVGIAWLCFTPTGRVYFSTGAANPNFNNGVTFVDLRVQINRPVGVKRFVLVSPTGLARLLSSP
jgi:type II secretory pathway pseudopilin PulG